MKRFVLTFVAGVLLLTLQTTFLTFSPVHKIRPDLVMILILYLGFSYPMILGGTLAFSLGYLVDLFSGNSLGLYTLTRTVVFVVAQLFKDRFYWQGFSFQLLFVFTLVLIEGLFTLFLLVGLNPNPLYTLYPTSILYLLPQSLLTALMSPILFFLFQKGSAWLVKKHRAEISGEVRP
jgi:rod shape-determining protein MreD